MKILISKNYSFIFALITLVGARASTAQQTPLPVQPQRAEETNTETLFPLAHFDERTICSLEEARKVQQFDATPDGSHWFAVDEFAHWQYITIDCQQFPERFYE